MNFRHIVFLCLVLTASQSLPGEVPGIIHFQGVISAHAENHHGPGLFKFSLINSNGTVTFWSNDGSGRNGTEPMASVEISVNHGLFSVNLGDSALSNMVPIPPVVFTNSDVRLRVWFRDPKEKKEDQGFTQLSPDQRITAVGYALVAATVPDGTITADKLAPGLDIGVFIRDGSITTEKLASNAVTSSRIAPGAVGAAQLADGSVATAKIAANAVGAANIASEAVGTAQLAAGAVTVEKLAPGLIIPAFVPDGSITTEKLADAAVTQRKLAAGAVGANQLADGAVGSNQLAPRAAIANLQASGLSGVASGAMLLSMEPNSAALTNAGYMPSGSFALSPDRWLTRTGPTTFFPEIVVWTGAELIAWGFPGARYTPSTDSWRPISSTGAPYSRGGQAFCWTGKELILWGGYDLNSGAIVQDGFLYNAATNSWRRMTTNGAPPFQLGTAVWTGSKMIVWGGNNANGVASNSGGRYDPTLNLWRPLSGSGSPSGRYDHTAVWTGQEMIIWGGATGLPPSVAVLSTGARYNPTDNTWTALPTANAPVAAHQHSAIWTGTEMIIWGGARGDSTPVRGGAAFNPASNSWRTITLLNAPEGRYQHTAVWTGREMIIWGGAGPAAIGTGARYNPAGDEWSSLTTDSAPATQIGANAFWTGSGMLVLGGRTSGSFTDSAILYFWQPPVTAYLYQRP